VKYIVQILDSTERWVDFDESDSLLSATISLYTNLGNDRRLIEVLSELPADPGVRPV
jgi:hypothetical protein